MAKSQPPKKTGSKKAAFKTGYGSKPDASKPWKVSETVTHRYAGKASKGLILARWDSQIPGKAESAVKAAYYRALGSGHVILVIEDGKLVKLQKENRTVLREVAPNMKIPKGTIYKLK